MLKVLYSTSLGGGGPKFSKNRLENAHSNNVVMDEYVSIKPIVELRSALSRKFDVLTNCYLRLKLAVHKWVDNNKMNSDNIEGK